MTGRRGTVEIPAIGEADAEVDVSLANQRPGVRPYDPEPGRDQIRGALAIALVVILGVVVAAGWVSLWWKLATEPEIKDLLGVILPPVVALVGSALGFYFGGKAAAGK